MAEENTNETMSDDDMAAAMEAMAEEGAGDDDMAAAMGDAGDAGADDMEAAMAQEGQGSTLSQDEIDSLLGFESAAEMPTMGIQALLDRSRENYERLPMLEVVFDRYVRAMSTSLRNFTGENADVSIESITSMRFEDYLNSVPLPALLAIFQAVEWENFGLITIDSSLTYSMVDIMLGGGRTHRPVRIEGRPFTNIEQDIVRSMSSLMLEEMSAAFNPLTPATFRMDRLETNPRFATITRPASAVILITTRVDMDERGGKAEILLPYGTLEPVKDLLIQMFAGESFGSDVSWESHLTSEVKSTNLDVMATLAEKTLTLRELGALEVGSTIVMDNSPNDDVDVTCKGIRMFSGKLGASNKNLAIQIGQVHSKAVEKFL